MADRNSPVATVSITGGEPLEQPEFTVAVARRLRSDGFRVYLETAGLHPEGLKMASPWVDVIAMDIKLPSSGMGVVWQEHKLALDLLRGTDFDPQTRGDRRTLFVKVVVDGNGRVDEIEEAARLVGRLGRSIPLVLQPENDTLTSHRRPRADASRLFEVIESGQRAALVHLDDVRVIPQCHKIMKVR